MSDYFWHDLTPAMKESLAPLVALCPKHGVEVKGTYSGLHAVLGWVYVVYYLCAYGWK